MSSLTGSVAEAIIFRLTVEIIGQNVHVPMNVNQLARSLKINPTYLNKALAAGIAYMQHSKTSAAHNEQDVELRFVGKEGTKQDAVVYRLVREILSDGFYDDDKMKNLSHRLKIHSDTLVNQTRRGITFLSRALASKNPTDHTVMLLTLLRTPMKEWSRLEQFVKDIHAPNSFGTLKPILAKAYAAMDELVL
jgi:hypothetical protein